MVDPWSIFPRPNFPFFPIFVALWFIVVINISFFVNYFFLHKILRFVKRSFVINIKFNAFILFFSFKDLFCKFSSISLICFQSIFFFRCQINLCLFPCSYIRSQPWICWWQFLFQFIWQIVHLKWYHIHSIYFLFFLYRL